ncbi:hypothetical protein TWF718_008707 [Orbilia javanica]|uniref:Uncharacterized protein n=1 Tax=Orbilia javanica TaxID=47235 RepID=A0AAN8MUY6_9PEZI
MGNRKNKNRNIHAIVVYGSDQWDLSCTYNFLSAVKSCYSRSIIPHALSTCNRSDLLELVSSANYNDGSQGTQIPPPSQASFLKSGYVPPITGTEGVPQPVDTSNADKEGFLPGNLFPQPIPTAQEAQDILEVLRPFYRHIQQEDIKLELRNHLQTLTPKLKPSSRLLLIICAQAVNTSGCVVLGRTIVNQDIMEYIDSLPLRSTAVVVSVAPGLDDRKEVPNIWEATSEPLDMEMQRSRASVGVVYTAAKVEVIKPLAELSVGREVRKVKDAGMVRLKSDIFSEFRPLKLGPWAYPSNEWKDVDSVAKYIEQVIDKNIVVKRFNPLTCARETIDRGRGIMRKEEPLDMSIYYLELRLQELKKKGEVEETVYEHAKKGMLALEGIMKRVIEQNKNCMHVAHVISSSSLFQQRVEETLRFMERADLRTEAFLQGAYKGGMLKFIDSSDMRLHVEAKGRLLETVRNVCPMFDSIIIPPKDCVGVEYWDHANRILKIIQGHVWQFRWFRMERFLEYMALNL